MAAQPHCGGVSLPRLVNQRFERQGWDAIFDIQGTDAALSKPSSPDAANLREPSATDTDN
jgi:hypothetical protein